MIVCITISVNYDNLLDIILPQNYKFFNKWYIVTEETDHKTIEVIRKHAFDNVEILFFDFKKNSLFNKGGGIQHALNKIDEGNMVLLLDSDIFIDDAFISFRQLDYEEDTLYSFKRYDYYSLKHFKEDIVDFEYKLNFMGFFQLFKYKKKYVYLDSENCRECDSVFSYRFPKRFLITSSSKMIKHLGRDNVNHFGRKNKDDFIVE